MMHLSICDVNLTSMMREVCLLLPLLLPAHATAARSALLLQLLYRCSLLARCLALLSHLHLLTPRPAGGTTQALLSWHRTWGSRIAVHVGDPCRLPPHACLPRTSSQRRQPCRVKQARPAAAVA